MDEIIAVYKFSVCKNWGNHLSTEDTFWARNFTEFACNINHGKFELAASFQHGTYTSIHHSEHLIMFVMCYTFIWIVIGSLYFNWIINDNL